MSAPELDIHAETCGCPQQRYDLHLSKGCKWFPPTVAPAVAEGTDDRLPSDEEPIEVGWYAYTGGTQSMIFHLRETGQWSAHFDNGTAGDCAWGYIEQALGVWGLQRIDLALATRSAD